MNPNLQNPNVVVVIDEDDNDLEIISQVTRHNQRPTCWPSQSSPGSSPYSADLIPQKSPVTTPQTYLASYLHNNITLTPKVNVELKSGDFLRIVNIIRDDVTPEVMIKGWIFQRTRDMNGILGKKMNEICWVLQLDEDDDREPELQGLEAVSVSEVLRRRHIRMTNLPFPKLSFREHRAESEEAIINKGVLVCRYKYICSYTDAKARYRGRWSEKQLNRLRAVECDHLSSEADKDLRHLWRGDTATGGACKRLKPGERLFLQREYSEMKPGARSYETAPSHDEHTTYQVIDLTGEESDIISCLQSHQESNKLSQDLQSNTISSREASLEIVEFHAQINTKSKRGTYRSEYESRMVSSYLPNSTDINRRKRSRYTNLGDSYHEKKRPNLGERTEPYKDKQINQVLAHAEEEPKEGENFASTLAGKKYRERSSSSVSIEEINISENTGTCNEVGKIIDLTNHSSTPKARKSVSSPNSLRTKIYSIDQDAEPLRTVFSGLPGNDSSNVERRHDHAAKSQASSKSRMIPNNNFSDSLMDQQRYTFGDCFCGGGGMSRGAIGSGLRVEWGFDCDPAACRTYDLNFFSLDVYCLWADQFLGLSDRDHKVDILHLSPPCQYFSHAHTINGKNDEMNTASLFAISDLLQKAKPRVVTLEQTAGLMGRHSSYCHAVVRMFTDHGFSIRWKALNLADFGLPQLRKRLIMIASCPGELLPNYPAPTHSHDPPPDSNLKPWTTIKNALDSVPHGWPNHDVERASVRDGPAQDPNTQSRTMTTSGAGIIHPSGKRNLTMREFAALQGFPLQHKFGDKGVKQQIGNAVPPLVATVLLKEIKNALMKADGLL